MKVFEQLSNTMKKELNKDKKLNHFQLHRVESCFSQTIAEVALLKWPIQFITKILRNIALMCNANTLGVATTYSAPPAGYLSSGKKVWIAFARIRVWIGSRDKRGLTGIGEREK